MRGGGRVLRVQGVAALHAGSRHVLEPRFLRLRECTCQLVLGLGRSWHSPREAAAMVSPWGVWQVWSRMLGWLSWELELDWESGWTGMLTAVGCGGRWTPGIASRRASSGVSAERRPLRRRRLMLGRNRRVGGSEGRWEKKRQVQKREWNQRTRLTNAAIKLARRPCAPGWMACALPALAPRSSRHRLRARTVFS